MKLNPSQSLLVVVYSVIGAVVLQGLVRPAVAQVQGTLPGFVLAQSATPGTTQTAHGHITGTMIAGQFQGNGAGLTDVVAKGLQLPFGIQAVHQAGMMELFNTSTTGTFPNFKSTSSAQSGVAIQGVGATTSSIGVYGKASGAFGLGLKGEATNTSAIGVFASATGANGVGLSATGSFIGAEVSCTAANGFGLYAISSGTNATAIEAEASQPTASALIAKNTSTGAFAALSGELGGVFTNGHYMKGYFGGTISNSTPIAYGVVTSTGAVASGTGNFSVTKGGTGVYDIAVVGETYSNSTHVVTVTPVTSSPLVTGVVNPGAGAFRVRVWNLSSVLTDAQFQFTVWTADPDQPNGGRMPQPRP